MKVEPYNPVERFADDLFVRSLLNGPVAQFAGHTSGHSAVYDFERFPVRGTSKAEPKADAIGFWIVVELAVSK